MKKNNSLKKYLSRLYFWFESYDNFSYSSPPWTTLLIMINILIFILLLFVNTVCIAAGFRIKFIGGKMDLMLFVYILLLFLFSTINSILLISKNKKIYRTMESLAGKDFLNLLWKNRKEQSLFFQFIVYFILLFVATIGNCSIIMYLSD